MGKGEATREAILDAAGRLARTVGLAGMTIGTLAASTELSKSGLYAHFRSKESLQLQVLEHAKSRFVAEVVSPALATTRGEPRVRALFDAKLRWNAQPGGCIFTSAAMELDDQPGPVRERVVRDQHDWLDTVAAVFGTGLTEGHFRPEAEPEQFAFEFDGIMLSYHSFKRLLGDEAAEARARRAFETLLDSVRVPR
jgi:AcrR family transcriptional regulator